MTMFKMITVKKQVELTKEIIKSKLEFFIPGINSGVYNPPTLCINIRIEEWRDMIFCKFKKFTTGAQITLSKEEFDSLYLEMTKIKELRDNKILNSHV